MKFLSDPRTFARLAAIALLILLAIRAKRPFSINDLDPVVLLPGLGWVIGARAPLSFFDKIGSRAMGLGLVVAAMSALSLPFCSGEFCAPELRTPVVSVSFGLAALVLIPLVVSMVLVAPRPVLAKIWPWALGLGLLSVAFALSGRCWIAAAIAFGVPLLLGGLGMGSLKRKPPTGDVGQVPGDDLKNSVPQWFSVMGQRFLIFFGVEFVALISVIVCTGEI